MDEPTDYPYVVIAAVKPVLIDLDGVKDVFGRVVSPNDPNGSVGIYPVDWTPTAYEIGMPFDPSLTAYHYGVDVLIKHSSEEEGSQVHAELSSRVRRALQGSGAIRTALGGLSVAHPGDDLASPSIERVLRWNVTRQTYAAVEINRTMAFLSVTNFDVDTETS